MKLLYLIVMTAFITFQCKEKKVISSQAENLVWLKYEAIQCLNNPWQKDYIERNNNDYNSYPAGEPRVVEEIEQRIIQHYYASQGLNILDVTSRTFTELGLPAMVCDACDCPQGYQLFIRVNKSQQSQFKELGFKTTPSPQELTNQEQGNE